MSLCALCGGDGWVDDPMACSDRDHCDPAMPCPDCNVTMFEHAADCQMLRPPPAGWPFDTFSCNCKTYPHPRGGAM